MQILVQNNIEDKQGSHLVCRVFDTTDLKCTLIGEEKKIVYHGLLKPTPDEPPPILRRQNWL